MRWSRGWVSLLLMLLMVGGPVTEAPAALREVSFARSPGRFPLSGFRLPLDPPAVVLTPFRPPPTRYGAGHRGVDLAAVDGSAVLAAGDGRVVFAGRLAGRGVVSVEHAGGLRTTYEPVMAGVRAGQPVNAGSPLGVLENGHPGCAPRPCLHWGARLPDGTYLDPLTLITGLRVRLKPWGSDRAP